MWKASIDVKTAAPVEADDWDTDPDYVNDVTEHEQSYGGKFGVQQDRMDKSAMGHDYVGKTEKHSAAGWEHRETVEKHSSQKDYSSGFGGKYGVQTDSQDAAALGWDQLQHTAPHDSQKGTSGTASKGLQSRFRACRPTDRTRPPWAGTSCSTRRRMTRRKVPVAPHLKDYSPGLGVKYGVQTDNQDAAALGWDQLQHTAPHDSQKGTSGTASKGLQSRFRCKGFGGKFGIETDRVDKSAHRFDEVEKEKDKVDTEPEDVSPEPVIEERKPINKIQPNKTAPQEIKQEIEEKRASQPVPAESGVEELETNLPDVTRVSAPKEDKQEITRQPTIVVSPVGWDQEEGAEGEGGEEEEGYTARALYDYQAAAPDEISFDPDDEITNIVM
ncbi:putative cortactin, partial [Operophtera brumata]